MDYLKINKFLFILFNLSWVLLILPLILYTFLFQENLVQLEGFRVTLSVIFLSLIQVFAFLKLKHRNIYPAIIAIIALSLIIDMGDFKSINKLLLNIDLLYTANGDFIFDLKFFHGPHTVMIARLTEFEFNQIGFNMVGLIQIFLLYKQKTENINTATDTLEQGSKEIVSSDSSSSS